MVVALEETFKHLAHLFKIINIFHKYQAIMVKIVLEQVKTYHSVLPTDVHP